MPFDEYTREGDEICTECNEAHPYDFDEDHGWSRRSWCAEVLEDSDDE